MNKKILYILIIIVLIIAGIFVAINMEDKEKTRPTAANALEERNNTKKDNVVEENNTLELEGNNNSIENNKVETEVTTSTPEEQAKQIAKENWGEDDSVYYSYDGMKDGKHVVCVRDNLTTKELCRYYVDTQTGSFYIE